MIVPEKRASKIIINNTTKGQKIMDKTVEHKGASSDILKFWAVSTVRAIEF